MTVREAVELAEKLTAKMIARCGADVALTLTNGKKISAAELEDIIAVSLLEVYGEEPKRDA